MRKSGTGMIPGESRIGKIGFNGIPQGRVVAGLNDHAGLALDDHFLISAGIAGNDSRLGRHGFQWCQAKALVA